ncbi:hypothetical protein EVAR_96975_1 [Eumeta japonica]|uniref:Uncharacterized protein n=1 Tax=Eumeta variegata TaxID=151549 RepID=A0A4C1VFB3_EUMVA|nr:hypothetical protein EVAR_96975_1 [Eumeta japonica]
MNAANALAYFRRDGPGADHPRGAPARHYRLPTSYLGVMAAISPCADAYEKSITSRSAYVSIIVKSVSADRLLVCSPVSEYLQVEEWFPGKYCVLQRLGSLQRLGEMFSLPRAQRGEVCGRPPPAPSAYPLRSADRFGRSPGPS